MCAGGYQIAQAMFSVELSPSLAVARADSLRPADPARHRQRRNPCFWVAVLHFHRTNGRYWNTPLSDWLFGIDPKYWTRLSLYEFLRCRSRDRVRRIRPHCYEEQRETEVSSSFRMLNDWRIRRRRPWHSAEQKQSRDSVIPSPYDSVLSELHTQGF